MSDDYYRVFYYWEPTINHHHYSIDGDAVVFHDHGKSRDDHAHDYYDEATSYAPLDNAEYHRLGPAHYYDDNVVRVHHTRNRYTVVNDYDPSDDNVTLTAPAVDLVNFRGS